MSSRKPVYLIGVTLLTLVLSAPAALFCLLLSIQPFQLRQYTLNIPGLGPKVTFGSPLSAAEFWGDKFVYTSFSQPTFASTVLNGRFIYTDPESGEVTDSGRLPEFMPSCNLMKFGDRLWVVDFANNNNFEFVEGRLQKSDFPTPVTWAPNGQRVLVNGQPGIIKRSKMRYALWTIVSGKWVESHDIAFPNINHDWSFGTSRVSFKHLRRIWCINQGSQIHVFAHVDGCMLYHDGLELIPASPPDSTPDVQVQSNVPQADDQRSTVTESIEDGSATGWMLVQDLKQFTDQYPHMNPDLIEVNPMLVEGQPVATMAGRMPSGGVIADFFRLDGKRWSQFATQTFRLGTEWLQTGICSNGKKSYLVATTPLGKSDVYAVESTGLRLTNGARQVEVIGMQHLRHLLVTVPLLFLGLAILCGLCVWLMMSWFTKLDYEFGHQTVKLASLGMRGLARLIDLVCIVGSAVGLGYVLTRGLDWFTLFEAMNNRIDHSTIHTAAFALAIIGFWLMVVSFSQLFAQAWWGLTLGKKICGLRTLRTSLRHCGFMRSLCRELMMWVDAGYCLCWGLGILSIALTNNRQRLGDLASDTIVVQSKSLPIV